MNKKDDLIYTLSKKMVVVIYIYYLIIIIAGIIISIKIMESVTTETPKLELIKNTFIVSLSVSGMLSSVRYVKSLYKACIMERIEASNNTLKCMGNFAYFIFRPIFSFVFSIIMIFAMLSGLFFISGNLDYILNEKFLYMCVVMSSIIGFSIGKLLDKFENLCSEKINNI